MYAQTFLQQQSILLSLPMYNMSCNNRCLFFHRLKLNHESHEFILEPWHCCEQFIFNWMLGSARKGRARPALWTRQQRYPRGERNISNGWDSQVALKAAHTPSRGGQFSKTERDPQARVAGNGKVTGTGDWLERINSALPYTGRLRKGKRTRRHNGQGNRTPHHTPH